MRHYAKQPYPQRGTTQPCLQAAHQPCAETGEEVFKYANRLFRLAAVGMFKTVAHAIHFAQARHVKPLYH